MLGTYLLKKKWHIMAFIALSIVSAIMMSLFSLHIADVFSAAELFDYAKVLKLLIFMFAWYIFIRLVDYYAELLGLYAVNCIRRDIKDDMFNCVIDQELSVFAVKNDGEYIAEFTNDITIIEMKYLIPLRECLTYVITIVAVCSTIATIDIRMTIVLAIGSIMCILLPIVTSKYTSTKMWLFLECFDKFVQYLKDIFGAVFVFKNYALEKEVSNQFVQKNKHMEKKKYKAEMALVVIKSIIGRLAWIIPLIIVVLGLQGVISDKISIGAVFSAYLLASELGTPLQCIGDRISMIQSVKGIDKKVVDLKRIKSIKKDDTGESINTTIDSIQKVIYKDVCLTLNGNNVLNHIDLSFEQGKKYLILGKNGSGKSTAVKLLKHVYLGFDGEITINGNSLKSRNGLKLSELISYSNETVALLSDTVKNNIQLYREISESELISALKKVNLSIPLSRQIGDQGRFLSSGERRKLEIARAIVRKPSVLIFDEIISTLDIETAYEIEEMILGFSETVVMISNAFSGQLLPRYDQIIIVDNGEIAATGDHNELLLKSEKYREIYEIRCGKIWGD